MAGGQLRAGFPKVARGERAAGGAAAAAVGAAAAAGGPGSGCGGWGPAGGGPVVPRMLQPAWRRGAYGATAGQAPDDGSSTTRLTAKFLSTVVFTSSHAAPPPAAQAPSRTGLRCGACWPRPRRRSCRAVLPRSGSRCGGRAGRRAGGKAAVRAARLRAPPCDLPGHLRRSWLHGVSGGPGMRWETPETPAYLSRRQCTSTQAGLTLRGAHPFQQPACMTSA